MNLQNLKSYIFYFFTLLLFVNCSNDEERIPENAIYEPQTELISLTGNNNKLELTWKPVVINKFKSYKVYRFETNASEFMNQEVIVHSGELVFETSKNLTTTYTDNEVPFNSFVGYAVVTEYVNEEDRQMTAISINYLFHENKELSFSLTSLEKTADGGLKLTWEEDTNTGFEKYTIHAIGASYLNNQEIYLPENIIKVNVNQKENNSIDLRQYVKPNVFYTVTKVVNGKTIKSKNILSIENPRGLKFKPGQTLKNPKNENEVIIIDNEGGEVIFYNVNNQNKDKVAVNGRIFFCSIGEYNGVEDLYVPSKEGNVFVIDLVTHQIKETISLKTDYDIWTAIPINNYIVFIEKHIHADIGGLLVYDRSTDKVLNRFGSFGTNANRKLVYAKGDYFYVLDPEGREYGSSTALTKLIVEGDEVSYYYTFEGAVADSHLFALSEDKSYFVSTNYGYQCDINYENFTEVLAGKYSQQLDLTDVKITADNRIYFSRMYSAGIDVFEKNNFNTPIKHYNTSAIPVRIEVLKNQIIAFNQLESSYIIESIPK
ncbi:hypothetical protein [Flavobacterium sp. LAR06]|uniref:hypothetical protein n=1 Tax=Flavobacterium sp. LAR06 TaxID=3064897 RepID=UPI0035BF32FA